MTDTGVVFPNSIILESDSSAVAQRVSFRSDDIPLGEQTVASVGVLENVGQSCLRVQSMRCK